VGGLGIYWYCGSLRRPLAYTSSRPMCAGVFLGTRQGRCCCSFRAHMPGVAKKHVPRWHGRNMR
jgi:hypothetical protein